MESFDVGLKLSAAVESVLVVAAVVAVVVVVATTRVFPPADAAFLRDVWAAGSDDSGPSRTSFA